MSPAVKPDLPSGTAPLKPLAAALLICWVAAVIALSIVDYKIILLGVSLEIVQLFLPYRTYNPQDMLVNAAGVAACLAVYCYRR